MVENTETISTDGHHQATEKKEKNTTKSRIKRSKSEAKHKSSKKDANSDKSDVLGKRSADRGSSELKIQVELKGSSRRNSREIYDQADNIDDWDEKDEPNGDEDLPSQHVAKLPSRQRSSKKGKKSSRKQSEKMGSSEKSTAENEHHNKHLVVPRRTRSFASNKKSNEVPKRTASYKSNKKSDEVEHEEKEKGRISGRSLKSSRRSRDSNQLKEDTRPSVPRRAVSSREGDNNSVDKPPSNRKLRKSKSLRQKEECGNEGMIEDADDKQPTKPGRRATRLVSPESGTVNNDDNELGVGSFHCLRKDSDKPRSRSSTGKRRTPNSGSKTRTPTGEKLNRRRPKDKTEALDDADGSGTQEINLKDEEMLASGSTKTRKERRKDRERLVSSDVIRETRKIKPSTSHAKTRRGGMRRSHSERWNRTVESMEDEGTESPHVVKRRTHDSLNRTSDGLGRSAHSHSRIRRNKSSGPTRMAGSLSNRSYHSSESDRRSSSDGRRTPRRSARRRQSAESLNSVGGDSPIDSYADGRSQGTLESIEDFEDFEDFYGMELQTPGMIDFEEEMLDLMQRANPEVTDHLDRRVHRKREMVVYDHNMPMMTRQALLTRQASSQVQRQFFDGSNIDKKRLLLRNDSMTSNNSSHRAMRSVLGGRREPPRAKSSGLGAMSRGGYIDSVGGPNRQSDADDRRGVFRSNSSQAASFNQYYQNKPNKVRNLSRNASGDLVQPLSMRRQGRSEHRRRPVQRAASTTAIRRSKSTDHVASRKPERKQSSDDDSGDDVEPGSSCSFKRSLTRDSVLSGKISEKIGDKNDMSNKRNRSKLHVLMYMTKMSIDMDDLFEKAREGEKPRSPIDTLRMPSP